MWGLEEQQPQDVLMCTELVLDPQGRLVQMNRLPGDNKVGRLFIPPIITQARFLPLADMITAVAMHH